MRFSLIRYSQHLQEIVNSDDINMGERDVLENIEVVVFSNEKTGIGSNGTVYKLIVIWIGNDKSKMIVGCDEYCTWVFCDSSHDSFCDVIASQPHKYFFILFENLGRYTKMMRSIYQRLIDTVVSASGRDDLYKSICVNDNIAHCYCFKMSRICKLRS